MEEGDAAAAFDALRAHVEILSGQLTTIGRGVGAVLDQLEAQGAPVDYRTDLGRLVQALDAVDDRLLAVERAPALRQDAGKLVEQFNEQRRILNRIDSLMDSRPARARERWRRNAWLGGAGAAGILVGVVLALAVPRFLPFSLAERTATTVMGLRAWEAGNRLMGFANKDAVDWIVAAQDLVNVNADTVASCRAAVAKAGKEQSCTIVMPVQGWSLEKIRP
ncbi:DUF6118 family protein [Methylobacterium sp. Gmos1]